VLADQRQGDAGASHVVGVGHEIALVEHVDPELAILKQSRRKGLAQHLAGELGFLAQQCVENLLNALIVLAD
jgi:hypothetical protein